MNTYTKINKKKLKEDELVAATSNALIYIRKNSKPITFITLVILILATSWMGLLFYKEKLNNDINREIFFILKETKSQTAVPQQKIDNLKKLEKKLFGNNIYSSLYLGHIYYRNGKFEDAINEYKKVLESKSSPLLKQNAVTGLGYSYESLGKYKDAINVFLKILNENNKTISNKEEIYISLGRLYEESGDYKSALEKYQFVVEKFPNIRNIEEIKEKAKSLKLVNSL
jgi:tetratricopeptide (TPR) repeat protein